MKTIETVVDIHAEPDDVWAVLTDTASYPEWNPFVTEMDGTLAEGERLRIRIEPPEGRAMNFKPRVTTFEPEQRLEWLGRLVVPGLFDGRHEFVLDSQHHNHTRVTHREHFSGLLVRFFLDEDDIRAGFEAMNEALRARVEGSEADEKPTDGSDEQSAKGATA